MNTHFPTRSLAALLTLSLITACFPNGAELEEIRLRVDRTADALRFSWDGDEVHRFEVVQCNDTPSQEHCACNGSLVWGLGAGENEKLDQVALEAPFIASPLEYGKTPESDRKGYEARPLVAGRTYLVEVARVGPCEENPQGCQKMIARGCQSFVW